MYSSDHFKTLVLKDTPLIDVRAPVEFAAGSLPGSINLPLMDDHQRHQVGKCFRKDGQEQAIKLGNKLVSGELKEQRISAWCDMIEQRQDTLLYCSRGGLRSTYAQRWIKERTGRNVPRIEGGYKGFRRYLLEQIERAALTEKAIVLGGRTGSGKTLLLQNLGNSIDLEQLAHHRGSSFGRYITPQPSQADFENRLAAAVIKHCNSDHVHMVVEDEGRNIGKRFIPPSLALFFRNAELVKLEESIERRIEVTYDEYVIAAQQEYLRTYGPSHGLTEWLISLEEGIGRIRKRLGQEKLKQTIGMLHDADNWQRQSGEPERHKRWIEVLLRDYYDPMYDYQLQKDQRPVVFKGDSGAVLEYLTAMG